MNFSHPIYETEVREQIWKAPKLLQESHKSEKWQPSSLELPVLKFYFQKDHNPTKERQDFILKKLNENFGSNISLEQLQDWVQEEIISKALKYRKKDFSNNAYVKFSQTELDLLEQIFEKDNYPSYEEMQKTADAFGVSLSKIENWYKHQRRSLAKRGELIMKTKKRFHPKEKDYLMALFTQNAKPSPQQIEMIARELSCTELQIKNWFSNRRKKLGRLSKKQSSSVHSSLANNISTTCGEDVYFNFKDYMTLAQTQTLKSNKFNVTSEINPSGFQAANVQVQATPIAAPNFSNQFLSITSPCFLIPHNLNLLPINFHANMTHVMMPLNGTSRFVFTQKNMNLGPLNHENFISNQVNENQKHLLFSQNFSL